MVATWPAIIACPSSPGRPFRRTLQHTLGAVTVVALLSALVVPVARAASPHGERPTSGAPLVSLVMATLAPLTSVQAHLTATSTGADAAAFGETVTAVRRAGQWQLDIVAGTRPVGAGDTTVAEYVVGGTTVCARSSFTAPRGPFMCRQSPREAADVTTDLLPLLNVLPPRAEDNNTYSYVHGGTAWVRGLRCDAYRYIVRSPTALERSTLYLNRATGAPCAQDATTVGPPLFGLGLAGVPRGTATTTSATVWGRFNDPTLTIPPVPASALSRAVATT